MDVDGMRSKFSTPNIPLILRKKSLMQRTGEIITELIDNDMKVSDTETTIEFNFALLKVKHTVKRKGKD